MNLNEINLCELSQFEQGLPLESFAVLRREAPLWWHPATELAPGGEGFWVVSTNDLGREVLKDFNHFSSETGRGAREGGGTTLEDMTDAPGQVLAMIDPPKHDDIRGLVNQGFFPRTLALLEEEVRRLSEAIVDRVDTEGEVDFLNLVAAELPLQVICSMAGLPEADWPKMVPWADAAIEYAAFDPESDREALVEKMTEMGIYGFAHIQQLREQAPNDSVLSQVVHARIPNTEIGADGVEYRTEGDRQLDDMELMRFFSLLITGGTETTRNAIAGGFHALLSNPEQWQALKQGDEALMKNAVEEILRYCAPVHFNRRTATEDLEFHGHQIKRGDKITVWYGSANRDDNVFDDPNRFDIHRHNANKNIAFGYGIHHCLGAALARMEIRIMLEVLIDRWGDRGIKTSGPIRFIRSNRHQGVAQMNIRFQS